MTQTLTTERLKWLHDVATELSAMKLKMTMKPDELLILTSELLANREAQSVGFYTTVSGRKGVIWHNGAPEDDTAIYTAPPEPAVPDESGPRDAFESVFPMPKYVVRCGAGYAVTAYSAWGANEFKERWEGWNACRAAMLEQPVSGSYKLPPHAYRELVNSLRDTAVKYSGTNQLRERLNTVLSQFIEPDHPHTRTTEPDRN